MMSASNECYICRQSNKKTRSGIICTGCNKRFCQHHYQEHRQSMVKDFDHLIEEHNVLRQQLFSENDDQNSTKLNLLIKIDNWEKDMIKNIQETAATTKTRLLHMINEEKDQIKNRFTLVANELKANQSDSDFVETDVQEWQKKLRDCKQKFEQLMVQNNDLIDIDIKLMDIKDSISINRKSDAKIQTRCNDQSRENMYERTSNYQTGQNSSRKNTRCAELRSANRFQKNRTNDSDGFCNSAREIINGDIYHDEEEDLYN